MAYKEFVISLFLQRPQANGDDLVEWVDKTLAAQVARLDRFRPTPQNQFDALKVDPDNLLARVVVDDRAARTPNPASFAVYGPDYLVHRADDEPAYQRLIDDAGVDHAALADRGYVIRTRDAAAAKSFATGVRTNESAHYDTFRAPAKVPDAQCLKLNSTGNPDREYAYRCYVTYKRYVAVVSSDEETDIGQKAAAQYALLANSL